MTNHDKSLGNVLEDARLFIGPILAVMASFMPWAYLGLFKDLTAFDLGAGIFFFLLALAAIGTILFTKPRMKGKGLLIIGILMTFCSVTTLLSLCDVLAQPEGKFVRLHMGVFFAITASLITVYDGYRVSSPDLTTPVPKIKKRKGLMVLNGIVGSLWVLAFLVFISEYHEACWLVASYIPRPHNVFPARELIRVISSPIVFTTYFYSIYAMFRFKKRAGVVYAAFAGIVGVLITLSASLSIPTSVFGFENFLVFALFLLIYALNLYYARETVSENNVIRRN